jgi:tRNA A37 threonylcarbamoyladenosine synthetase subunit TsaC/SUA5/YrdC
MSSTCVVRIPDKLRDIPLLKSLDGPLGAQSLNLLGTEAFILGDKAAGA